MLPVKYDKHAQTPEELLDSFKALNNSSWYLEPLMEVAKECAHITEFGIFQGQSIAAFLVNKPSKIVAYDINMSLVDIPYFTKLSGQTTLYFKQANSLFFSIKEKTCLLFLDTRHVYEHVWTELKNHGNMSTKYIVIHDTNCPPPEKRKEPFTLFPDKLVRDAVLDWIKENEDWEVYKDITIETGMMILKRKQ